MPSSDPTQATDQVKRAEDLMKKLTAVDMAPAAAFIDEYITATTEPPRRIPEPVFRELFLPFFLGERPADEQPELIAHWIGLIGSASLPADIVDATGNVLFFSSPRRPSRTHGLPPREPQLTFRRSASAIHRA